MKSRATTAEQSAAEMPLRSAWDRYWRTREGTVIRISDMEDRHLVNTIGYIMGRGDGWRGDFMPSLLKELRHRKKLGRCNFEDGGAELDVSSVTSDTATPPQAASR